MTGSLTSESHAGIRRVSVQNTECSEGDLMRLQSVSSIDRQRRSLSMPEERKASTFGRTPQPSTRAHPDSGGHRTESQFSSPVFGASVGTSMTHDSFLRNFRKVGDHIQEELDHEHRALAEFSENTLHSPPDKPVAAAHDSSERNRHSRQIGSGSAISDVPIARELAGQQRWSVEEEKRVAENQYRLEREHQWRIEDEKRIAARLLALQPGGVVQATQHETTVDVRDTPLGRSPPPHTSSPLDSSDPPPHRAASKRRRRPDVPSLAPVDADAAADSDEEDVPLSPQQRAAAETKARQEQQRVKRREEDMKRSATWERFVGATGVPGGQKGELEELLRELGGEASEFRVSCALAAKKTKARVKEIWPEFQQLRDQFGMEHVRYSDVAQLLDTGVCYSLLGRQTKEGEGIVVFSGALYDANRELFADNERLPHALFVVLELCLRECGCRSVCLIADVGGCGPRAVMGFRRLAKRVSQLLKGKYPLRFSRAVVINGTTTTNWAIRSLVAVQCSRLLRNGRLAFTNSAGLLDHFSARDLPVKWHGSLLVDCGHFQRRCEASLSEEYLAPDFMDMRPSPCRTSQQ